MLFVPRVTHIYAIDSFDPVSRMNKYPPYYQPWTINKLRFCIRHILENGTDYALVSPLSTDNVMRLGVTAKILGDNLDEDRQVWTLTFQTTHKIVLRYYYNKDCNTNWPDDICNINTVINVGFTGDVAKMSERYQERCLPTTHLLACLGSLCAWNMYEDEVSSLGEQGWCGTEDIYDAGHMGDIIEAYEESEVDINKE